MNNIYQFNKNFFDEDDRINWFDKKGVIQLNENTNVTITLYNCDNNTYYNGYLVSIINKNSGLIDSHLFKFNNYLKNRVDNIKLYNGGFCVSMSSCKWYVAIPSEQDVNNMCNEIMSYIKLWR